jgi:hypothetical protein
MDIFRLHRTEQFEQRPKHIIQEQERSVRYYNHILSITKKYKDIVFILP